MIDAESLLPPALRGDHTTRLSCICVRTAEPKYLLFDNDPTVPRYVVQHGNAEAIHTVFDATSRLHAALPSRIPEPLSLTYGANERASLVQRGLGGQPWFTLREQMATIDGWERVRDASIEALRALHEVSHSQSDWRSEFNPGALFSKLRTQPGLLSEPQAALADPLDHYQEQLSSLETFSAFPQHGDFCVNNLMFTPDRPAGILDFEQFGRVFLPLHDEFLLCGSLLSMHPARTAEVDAALWEQLTSTTRYPTLTSSADVAALFGLHVLWWIDETDGQALRGVKAANYQRALHTLGDGAHTWQPGTTVI